MPARRRRNKEAAATAPVDPVSQFGRLLREADERERAEKEQAARQRQAAKDAARAHAAQAEEVAAARRDLERAIGAVKAARRDRRGMAEADAAWRQAKARLITLETGDPPAWHPEGDEETTADAPRATEQESETESEPETGAAG